MNTREKLRPFSLLLLITTALSALAQDVTVVSNAGGFGGGTKALHDLTSVTPAYRTAALRLIVADANRVARELHLAEYLPIEETHLVASYITPPNLVERLGAIGNVTSTNYTYYFSVGRKFSFLTRTGSERDYVKLCNQCLLPMSRMDTNSAYRLAVAWLAEASMDVQALNKDCDVHILAFTPQGDNGRYFVPVYWVYWVPVGGQSYGSVASVELFEPTHSLRQLRVEKSEYIRRKPLEIEKLQ